MSLSFNSLLPTTFIIDLIGDPAPASSNGRTGEHPTENIDIDGICPSNSGDSEVEEPNIANDLNNTTRSPEATEICVVPLPTGTTVCVVPLTFI